MTPEVPETFRDALRSIQDREFLGTKRYREQQWRAKREHGDAQILLFERLLVRRMGKIGVPMFCNEVLRSSERQAELKAAGRSQVLHGPHLFGMACDVVHSIRGWEIDRKAWALVGHVGKEIIAAEGLSMSWGGDWQFYDPAHWERTDWRKLTAEDYPF